MPPSTRAGAVHAYGSRVAIDGNTSFYSNTALRDAGDNCVSTVAYGKYACKCTQTGGQVATVAKVLLITYWCGQQHIENNVEQYGVERKTRLVYLLCRTAVVRHLM